MILLYGAGGVPGRGEIPMNTVQHTVTQVFPVKDYEDYEKYYDEIVIPKELYGVHPKAAITERNRWMVTNTDVFWSPIYATKAAEQPPVCVWRSSSDGQL